MKWSWRIGRWFGIQVRVHATFGLLLAWVAAEAFADTTSVLAVIGHVTLVCTIFGFVVLHEYGHALTARHYGIRTRDITLYPIGGVAMLEGMPDDPSQELRIALAGPAVNFALAGGLWGLSHVLFGGSGPAADIIRFMIWVNLVMGTFNMLPALPMDGGRVLRAALAMRMPARRATQIAARVARGVAILMAVYSFTPGGTGTLLLIAMFVWFASGAELRATQARNPPQRPPTVVFRARRGSEAAGMHVVYGSDGRRLFVGEL